MSMESNKRDFENALSEMKDNIPLLADCVDDLLVATIRRVAYEYEVHYKGDIKEMIDANTDMKDKLCT